MLMRWRSFQVDLEVLPTLIQNLIEDCPNHKFLILQGNLPRLKKNQPESGVDGMKDILEKNSYSIFKAYEWNNYQKPVVIGERR